MPRIIAPGGGVLYDTKAVDLTAWTAYTPILTADVTNPTLGTGSISQGRYIRFGDVVIYRFHIQFGTSGAAAGSGEYEVSVPVNISSDTPATAQAGLGMGMAFDWSVASRRELMEISRKTATLLNMHIKDASVFDNNPWVWANDDRFGATVVYQAA